MFVSVRPTFSARHRASRSIHVVATGSHPPLGPRGAPSLRVATSLCPTVPRRVPGRLPCAGCRDGGRSGHRGAGVLSTSCFGFLRVTAQTWTRWATGLETTIPRTWQLISGVAEICHGPGRRFVVPCPLPAALSLARLRSESGPERGDRERRPCVCPSQECVPEDLELKRKVFAQLDRLAGDDVVLASSTSCLLPSRLFAGLAHVRQCIVAHPVSTWPAGWGHPSVAAAARFG